MGDCSDSDDDCAADSGAIMASALEDTVSLQILLSQQRMVLIVMDMEVGGLHAGIVQLAASAVHLNTGDVMGSFNEYIRPPSICLWSSRTAQAHGLYANHPKIVQAGSMRAVWARFSVWVESHVTDSKRGCLSAWGGAACDMEWYFKLTESGHPGVGPDGTRGILPPLKNCDYFWDPLVTIKNYKKYALHPSNLSEDHGQSLEVTEL